MFMRKNVLPPHISSSLSGVALMMGLFGVAVQAEEMPHQRWSIENLDQPESVVVDPNSGRLFISNINGAPLELNGKGYISMASNQGKMLKQVWAKGMDAPKGLAVVEDRLYVADMQRVHVVDLNSGEIIKQLKAADAKMLNDVTAAPDGSVYVSDMLGGSIYRVTANSIERWFSAEQLPHPNGLYWHENSLLIAGWGKPMNNDFSTDTPGTLYRLDPSSKALSVVVSGYQLGNLDGVEVHGDAMYISDWISGELFKLQGKERRKVMSPGAGLADIAVSGRYLYAPMMMDNRLVAWQLAVDK